MVPLLDRGREVGKRTGNGLRSVRKGELNKRDGLYLSEQKKGWKRRRYVTLVIYSTARGTTTVIPTVISMSIRDDYKRHRRQQGFDPSGTRHSVQIHSSEFCREVETCSAKSKVNGGGGQLHWRGGNGARAGLRSTCAARRWTYWQLRQMAITCTFEAEGTGSWHCCSYKSIESFDNESMSHTCRQRSLDPLTPSPTPCPLY